MDVSGGRIVDAASGPVSADRSPHDGLTALVGRIALAGFAILIAWLLSDVLLLLFLAVLFACVLRAASLWAARTLSIPPRLALAATVLIVLAAAAACVYWIAPEIARQSQDLANRVAQEWSALRHHAGPALGGGQPGNILPRLQAISGRIASPIGTAIGSAFDVIAGAIVVAVTSLYLASNPDLYVRGALHLVPIGRRDRMRETMLSVGHVLRLWFLGQLVDMATVGVLASIGLLLVGVPVPFALGLIAAALTFIPYFGAILAAIPAVLVALTVSLPTALWALGVYTLCHCVEGYIVAPLVQRRMVELPPAVTVIAMTVAGALFGLFGLALGTPLAAASLVTVRMLYVEDALGDHAAG